MENKIVYSEGVVRNSCYLSSYNGECGRLWWEVPETKYVIFDSVTMAIDEVVSYVEKNIEGKETGRLRYRWTGIELSGENEIFMHISCDCYPNIDMLYLTVDELKNISENIIDGYTYKNITLKIENDWKNNDYLDGELHLTSTSKDPKVVEHFRNACHISPKLLKMAIDKLKQENVI